MREFVIDERFETLRDALRQASVHSPSARTRWAAEACLEQSRAVALLRVAQSLSLRFAPRLRALIDDYWKETADAH